MTGVNLLGVQADRLEHAAHEARADAADLRRRSTTDDQRRWVTIDGEAHDFHARGVGGQVPTLMHQDGKKAAGRLLDGRTWDEMPTVAS